MIQSFDSVSQANEWFDAHPEWEPIGFSVFSSGSVIVLLKRKVPTARMTPVEPKRRGRPPKVQDAV